MFFSKINLKAAALVLAGMASSAFSQALAPLQTTADEWNYLTNFKLFGQAGLSFGNQDEFPNEAGWVGTADGDLYSTGNNGKVGGAIIVGGTIHPHSNMQFTTGPIRSMISPSARSQAGSMSPFCISKRDRSKLWAHVSQLMPSGRSSFAAVKKASPFGSRARGLASPFTKSERKPFSRAVTHGTGADQRPSASLRQPTMSRKPDTTARAPGAHAKTSPESALPRWSVRDRRCSPALRMMRTSPSPALAALQARAIVANGCEDEPSAASSPFVET